MRRLSLLCSIYKYTDISFRRLLSFQTSSTRCDYPKAVLGYWDYLRTLQKKIILKGTLKVMCEKVNRINLTQNTSSGGGLLQLLLLLLLLLLLWIFGMLEVFEIAGKKCLTVRTLKTFSPHGIM